MGTGRLKNGNYDVSVIANFVMSAADWTEWERAFKKASEILFDASDGQLEFGTFYVCDDSVGLNTADFILYPSGDPSFASGGFGQPGAAMHLMPYVKNAILTILHEWGHHAWQLGEEYAGPLLNDTIDTSAPAPNNSTIPIIDSGRAADELVALDANAILIIGGVIERKAVTTNTATTVTVESPFSALPTAADSATVWYQTPAECSAMVGSDFCIMEKSRTAAGSFDAGGNWIPAANPVTEYCTASNHDPDSDTQQEDDHGRSCWEKIVGTPGYTDLIGPDPADPGPTTEFTIPNWIVLDQQPRFAVLIDRSGSMATGNKIADAQHGATYWLEYCAQGDDLLTILWYDHTRGSILDLQVVSELGELTPTVTAIDALTPRGSTNIRDGLLAALAQIEGPSTRAAVQSTLLLTDGIHNTPAGSQATEVIPEFQNGGCRIYTLGVGDAAAVAMDTLDELAEETGGRSYAVGDDNPGDIEAAMIEISAEVRGGIITTQPNIMPDSKRSPHSKTISQLAGRNKRPTLKELMDALGIGRVDDLIRPNPDLAPFVKVTKAFVEEHCSRASFSIAHPEKNDVWLYLIDPVKNPVDMSAAGIHHVISPAPHEFAIVDTPKSGSWLLVAVRATPGDAFTFQSVVGGENSHLQVFGGAPTKNGVGDAVRLWASARWDEQLSQLRVRGVITDPSGRRFRVQLTDNHRTPNGGDYEGMFRPQIAGRYRAIIEVTSNGRASAADPFHRILHADGVNRLSTKLNIPPFIRTVRFYFDVGNRKKVIDREQRVRGKVPPPPPRRQGPPKSAQRTIEKR